MGRKYKYVFDGQVYAQRLTGQYRYADEILMELDKIISKDAFEIVVPNYVNIDGKFKNIKVIYYGNVKGLLWTQTSLLCYLLKNRAISIGFCNITPLLRPGITVVHDIGYKVLRKHYKNLYGRLSSLWHRLNYWIIARSKMPVITVSNFSKKQITEIYKVSPDRISVIGNGWQHYEKIKEDNSVFEKFSDIKPHQYYFAIGSLEERKNFKWIMEAAKRNPGSMFVIAGGKVKNATHELDFSEVSNVKFVGYIKDGMAKGLMANCKAFLFPSTFEGFGIPPLEALSVGAKVICSDIACLHEICRDAVRYIDPEDYDVDLDKCLVEDTGSAESVLGRYSWQLSAELLKNLLNHIRSKP